MSTCDGRMLPQPDGWPMSPPRVPRPSACPLETVPADQRAGQGDKRFVHEGQSLIADGQPPVSPQPGERALHHPAMLPQPLARLDAAAGDARCDAASAAGIATAVEVVALV